jgi:aspartate/methionine/tyrosine aminotransferase
MSKNFGSPGLRVGWIASSPENVAALAGVLERENISVCGPAQDAARALLDGGNAALAARTAAGRQRLGERLAAVDGVRFALPAGGTHLVARLPVADVEDFCDFALVEAGLGLVSSSNYEGVSDPFVRLPLGVPAAVIDEAVGLLDQALADYRAATPALTAPRPAESRRARRGAPAAPRRNRTPTST